MLKIELPYDSAIVLLSIYSKDPDVVKRRSTCTPMFIAAVSMLARLWKELKCPSTDEWKRRCGPYIQWTITQPSEGTNAHNLHGHRWNWRRLC